ncbi:lymphoid enhancer-binding factor 1-like [Phyllopteryx taeniolatus]|uniref:lymphoid enhancer-binding factor 1-like n=1 Tax=Phyllopteryx taeniolatus TaxID=161469 RepID=UPI002AD1E216|nr:lymphoid enhancer-binding factor 1-like [Phyllopteryx taeniolatus]
MHGEVHRALHQEAPSCIHDLHGGFVKAAAPWQDSAAVNKVLGQLWKSLTPAELLSYFQESERLSRIHATRYPDWTYRDNYCKKQKRKWGSAATSVNHLTGKYSISQYF